MLKTRQNSYVKRIPDSCCFQGNHSCEILFEYLNGSVSSALPFYNSRSVRFVVAVRLFIGFFALAFLID